MSSDRKINKTISTSQSRCCDDLTYAINFNNKLKPRKRFFRLFRLHLFARKENGSDVLLSKSLLKSYLWIFQFQFLSKLILFFFAKNHRIFLNNILEYLIFKKFSQTLKGNTSLYIKMIKLIRRLF